MFTFSNVNKSLETWIRVNLIQTCEKKFFEHNELIKLTFNLILICKDIILCNKS